MANSQTSYNWRQPQYNNGRFQVVQLHNTVQVSKGTYWLVYMCESCRAQVIATYNHNRNSQSQLLLSESLHDFHLTKLDKDGDRQDNSQEEDKKLKKRVVGSRQRSCSNPTINVDFCMPS